MTSIQLRPWISLVLAIGFGGAGAGDRKIFETDCLTDEELRQLRAERVSGLEARARAVNPIRHASGTTYQGLFFCTLYYTPKESGFTAERGFDVTPATAPGLRGRRYPISFLQAVKKEGFGRLVVAVDGRHYLRYAGSGRYQFAEAPLGSRGNVLVPRQSCAVSKQNRFLAQKMKIIIDDKTVEAVTGSREWDVSDTGGGVHPLQIDLYWGEDEPRGSEGRQRARPAGTALEYAFDVTVEIK